MKCAKCGSPTRLGVPCQGCGNIIHAAFRRPVLPPTKIEVVSFSPLKKGDTSIPAEEVPAADEA